MPAIAAVVPVHYASPDSLATACGQLTKYHQLVTTHWEKVTCRFCLERRVEPRDVIEEYLPPLERARKLLDGVLAHPLTDDQAMVLAGHYIELARVEKLVEDGYRNTPPSSHSD